MSQVVTISTDVWGTPPPTGRIVFYNPNDGYFYIFYPRNSDGYLVYRSSKDGIVWSAEKLASHEKLGGAGGYHVFFDGSKVIIVYATGTYSTTSSTSSKLWVRHGIPSNGNIVWEDPIQIYTAGGYWQIDMCKTQNYYFLAFRAFYTYSAYYYLHLLVSSDGKAWSEIWYWNTGSGYASGIAVAPHPTLPDTVILVAARRNDANLIYGIFDSTGLLKTDYFGKKEQFKYLTQFTLVTANGKTHIVYPPKNAGGPLRWQYFDGAWSSIQTIDTATCLSPSLAAAPDALHVFYVVGDEIRHRTMDYDTLTWSDYELIADGEDTPRLTQTMPYPTALIPIAWRAGSARPYSLRFTFIGAPPPGVIGLSETLLLSDQVSLVARAPPRLTETLVLSDQLTTIYSPPRLPYVRDHIDVIEDEYHNRHVVLWRWQLSLCEDWSSNFIEISDLVDELSKIINSMYYVKERDDVLSREHNLFVRAWRKLVEIDGMLVPDLPEYKELKQVVDGMEEIGYGTIYFADYHNRFVRAWELQLRLNAEIEKIPPPKLVIILDREDWQGALKYVKDDAIIIVDPTIDTVTNAEVKELLASYRVKIMVAVDTQPYHKAYCGAFKDILYAVDNFTGYASAPYDFLRDHDAQHFGATAAPHYYDYLTPASDHSPEATPWTINPDYYQAYRYYGKGVAVEVPYDGFWQTLDWLDKFLRWKPCHYPETWEPSNVICISQTVTGAPEWHEHPSLVDALKAWAEKYGYKFLDLRTK